MFRATDNLPPVTNESDPPSNVSCSTQSGIINISKEIKIKVK